MEQWSRVANVLPNVAPEATRIQSGYFATVNDPLQLFRCRPAAWCPGGMPGLVCKRLRRLGSGVSRFAEFRCVARQPFPALRFQAFMFLIFNMFQSWEDNPRGLGLTVFGLKPPISFASVHDAPPVLA